MRPILLLGMMAPAIAFTVCLLSVWEVSADGLAFRKLYPESFVAVLVVLILLTGTLIAFIERRSRRIIAWGWYVMATMLFIGFWVVFTVAAVDERVISWTYPTQTH